MSDESPNVVIMAGPNGSGKSTVAPQLLRDYLGVRTFVNADAIAQGLSAFDVESAAVEAGRVMLARMHQLAEERVSFAFETTLASRTFAPWMSRLKGEAYRTHLIFLWLPSPEMAAARVKMRVAEGGHDVPEDVIRRRYERGLHNLVHLYIPLMDTWKCVHGESRHRHSVIAHGTHGVDTVLDEFRWQQILEQADG